MNLNDIYRMNPSVITSTANNITRAVSLESEDSNLVILKGVVALSLPFFDGVATLEQVRKKIESAHNITGSQDDFLKMITFLINNHLIIKV